MRILFFADNFPPERNAAAARVFERARYWVRWGHEVTVLTCAPNFPEGKVFPGYRNSWRATEVLDGVRVVRGKTFIAPNRGKWRRALDYLSYAVTSVPLALMERRPDVVAATSPQFFAAVAGWAASVLLRRPFVFEISDLWPASIAAVGAMGKGWAYRMLEGMELFLYDRAAAIVAQTGAFREDLVARGVAPEKIAVVMNGVELANYSPRPRSEEKMREFGLPEGRFVIGYLGTLGMAHALENVLAAAERVEDAPVHFLLLGPGAEREQVERSAAARGLRNVTIAPAQGREAMAACWSVCDAALVHLKNTPVFSTVVPSKIFEAMAMGLPVLLAAPEGEASRLVEREGAGVRVAAEDPEALAAAARQWAADADGCARMGQAAWAAAPHYSRERQARAMLACLEAAAEQPGRRPAYVRAAEGGKGA